MSNLSQREHSLDRNAQKLKDLSGQTGLCVYVENVR
jgi:hypothetical protein